MPTAASAAIVSRVAHADGPCDSPRIAATPSCTVWWMAGIPWAMIPPPTRNMAAVPAIDRARMSHGQALNMMNGDFLLDQAARFAARVEQEAGSDPGLQVCRAIELAFGREATTREIAAGRDLVAAHGLPILCRSLYNASEFITIY